MIEFLDAGFSYQKTSGHPALSGVDLAIDDGDFVAVVGANGSGKSTLAYLTNGLLVCTKGRVLIDGLDPADQGDTWRVRESVALVFQNPENQIVATLVEEDIAFGPENLGLGREEVCRRVDEALEQTGLKNLARSEPHLLSGGQKQLVAIAGALAMRPKYLVLDEPTSMLDPAGRRRVFDLLLRLNAKGMTIILITHVPEEAVRARRVVLLEHGEIAADGSPKDVFGLGLDLPSVETPLPLRLARELVEEGVSIDGDPLTVEEFVEAYANAVR